MQPPHTYKRQQTINQHAHLGLVLDIISADLAIKPLTIIETIKMKYEYSISYWKAWHAKQHALRFLFGGRKETYNLLPEYMAAIKAANDGTRYSFKLGAINSNGETEFEGLFWAFGPSLHGFKFCKPVLTVNGIFLSGKYLGTVLTVIAKDPNGQLFPVAFALVEREKNETWG
jgi:hypothetical protein